MAYRKEEVVKKIILGLVLITFAALSGTGVIAGDTAKTGATGGIVIGNDRMSGADIFINEDQSGNCQLYGCYLIVQELRQIATRTTDMVLNYLIFRDDGSMLRGFGSIPQEAFRSDGASGKAALSVDTRSILGFSAYTCSQPTMPPSIYCIQDGGGIINLEWSANGEVKVKNFNSQKRIESCCGTYDEDWRTEEFSANATGDIIGIPINSTTCYVSSHGSEMIKSKTY